jgi:hypothetical protein
MTGALTDEQLFNLCKTYGENARHWRQKFMGLLPEVYKRRLYEKKHFSSIFEFAAKLAGISQEHVRRVLNLERKFEDKPTLHSLLINGKVSANKLVRIASIATVGNQEELARMMETLSNRAIETFVKDEKRALQTEKSSKESLNIFELMDTKNVPGNVFSCNPGNQNGLREPLFRGKSLHVHTQIKTHDIGALVKIMEKLSVEVQNKLLALAEKNIDINKIILDALNNRETKIAQEKAELSMEINCRVRAKNDTSVERTTTPGTKDHAADQSTKVGAKGTAPAKKSSRYIPAKIRKIINEEQGDKCSVPDCVKAAEVMHHELPFAIAKTHDPHNLKKLCRAHHELRHMINVRFYECHTPRAAPYPTRM